MNDVMLELIKFMHVQRYFVAISQYINVDTDIIISTNRPTTTTRGKLLVIRSCCKLSFTCKERNILHTGLVRHSLTSVLVASVHSIHYPQLIDVTFRDFIARFAETC